MKVNLTDDSDSFIWHLTESGVFSVKSLYTDLMNGYTRFLHKYLWKIKVPLNIKIFMWFLHKKILLTKYNLAKRNWNGCKNVLFAVQRSLLSICFLNVPLLNLFGELCTSLSIYLLPLILRTCLVIG
jgi:hypothetical protein